MTIEQRINAKAAKWRHEWKWSTSVPGDLTDDIDIRDEGHTVWTVIEAGYYLRDEDQPGHPCDCVYHDYCQGCGEPFATKLGDGCVTCDERILRGDS